MSSVEILTHLARARARANDRIRNEIGGAGRLLIDHLACIGGVERVAIARHVARPPLDEFAITVRSRPGRAVCARLGAPHLDVALDRDVLVRPREPVALDRLCGWWLRSNLRRVVDGGRQRETAGDGGSLLLRVSRASTHGQKTLGAIGSHRKQEAIGSNRKS